MVGVVGGVVVIGFGVIWEVVLVMMVVVVVGCCGWGLVL